MSPVLPGGIQTHVLSTRQGLGLTQRLIYYSGRGRVHSSFQSQTDTSYINPGGSHSHAFPPGPGGVQFHARPSGPKEGLVHAYPIALGRAKLTSCLPPMVAVDLMSQEKYVNHAFLVVSRGFNVVSRSGREPRLRPLASSKPHFIFLICKGSSSRVVSRPKRAKPTPHLPPRREPSPRPFSSFRKRLS